MMLVRNIPLMHTRRPRPPRVDGQREPERHERNETVEPAM